MNPAESYILDQDEPYRSILLQLQGLIEQIVPEVELLYKYRIPFYYLGGKPFCYLNQARDYVDVGFWHAAYLTRHLDKMEQKGRKIMRSLRYRHSEEIDVKVLSEVLLEASSFVGKSFFNKGSSD
jgi:hypothetical protein